MTFTQEDQHHLEAASGYIELGLHLYANEELEKITPELRVLPQVLAFRLHIYQALEKWVAKTLAMTQPSNAQWWISWAYATRRADCLAAARLILENALEPHPACAIIHYNLACYECQLGNVDAAKDRLKKAFETDIGLRAQALEDEDLEQLWNLNNRL